jgi:hypothetical protein
MNMELMFTMTNPKKGKLKVFNKIKAQNLKNEIAQIMNKAYNKTIFCCRLYILKSPN